MIRLIFTDVVVAIEGDRQPDPLNRSRELTRGHRWSIFFTLFPLMLLDLVAMYFALDRNQGVQHSRLTFALVECILAVPEQLSTIAIFLIYVGVRRAAQNSVTKLKP
jgi:hypothetical protein